MIPQVNLRKPEGRNRRLVTFSKRKSSLIRKARDMSATCNVDIAVVAFSPAARPNIFCSQNRIESLLWRYITLPAEKRNCHVTLVKEKVRRLGQLAHVEGDDNKLLFLDNQIKHMEQLIRRSELELEVMEDYLRDYEPDPKREPSPGELLRCEENLRRSLHRVTEKEVKQMEAGQQYARSPFPYGNFSSSDLLLGAQNQTMNPLYKQHGSRIFKPDSFHGSVVGASSHLLNPTIKGFSTSPLTVEGITRECFGSVNGKKPVTFGSSCLFSNNRATLVQSRAPVTIQQFCTPEVSYYSTNATTQEDHYLAAEPSLQFPADHGNIGSYQGMNSTPLLQHKPCSIAYLESQNVSENLSLPTLGPSFDSLSSPISMANGSSSAETGNEFSAHLNHLTDPLEEDPLDFDLPDLLSTEAMLVELESPSFNGPSEEEEIWS